MTLNTYKDFAGCQILGIESLPAHWSENKLGYLFNLGKGLTITKQDLVDEGVPCLNYGEVHSKYGFEANPSIHPLKCVPQSYLKSNPSALLQRGDFVFADTSEDIEGAGNFSQLISTHPTFAGYHTIIARPVCTVFPRFFAYLFHSEEFRNQIRLLVKGVKVFSISQGILKSASVWLPTKEEQQKIAQFLDYETAKIDALIDEQKRLMELLKEKRQAVISHAVTKGLNPDAPMKDSGVEWLGEVPKHWRVSPLRYATKFQEGPGILAKDFKDGGVPLIRISGVQGSEVTTSGCNFLDPELVSKKWKHFRLNKGDLVISGSASMELVSEVTKETQGSILYTGLIRINSVNRVTQKSFIKVFLASKMFFTQIDMLKAGSTIQHFGPSHLNQMHIVIPPLYEQQEIADYVNHQIQRFESLIKQAQRQTKLLQERRSALISAAVTGKIDVRDWQPPAGSDTVDSNASMQTERLYG